MKRLLVLLAACGGGSDSPTQDAAIDATVDQSTSVTATFMATRVLDHAFYGVNADDGTLHVELDKGGDGMCPTMTSPQPQYTLILGRLDPLPMTTPATFLDYVGDMLGNALNASATSVTLDDIVYVPGSSLSVTVNATFDGGTASGHLYAPHCDSLDG